MGIEKREGVLVKYPLPLLSVVQFLGIAILLVSEAGSESRRCLASLFIKAGKWSFPAACAGRLLLELLESFALVRPIWAPKAQ